MDSVGNVYISDSANHRVRRISVDGTITTVAGNGTAGFSGDFGLATEASLNYPMGLAVDGGGNLFIAERNGARVRMVSANGIISTVAGNGTPGFSGDEGPANAAQLSGPWGIALDSQCNLYIADTFNNRIRKVGADGIITTVAGSGFFGYFSDNIPATSIGASLSWPTDVAVHSDGTIYSKRVARPRSLTTIMSVEIRYAAATANRFRCSSRSGVFPAYLVTTRRDPSH